MRITEQPVTPAGVKTAVPLLIYRLNERRQPTGHRAIRGAKTGELLHVIARHSGTFRGRWRLVCMTRHSETAERAWQLHQANLRQGGLCLLSVELPFAYPMDPIIDQFRYESRKVRKHD